MAYMYILECCDESFYTGSTNNLPRRLWQHQNGMGANHTAKRLPVKLVYAEKFEHVADAFYREKQVQGWSRAKKMALIEGEWDRLHVLAECQNESHFWRTGVNEMSPQDYAGFLHEVKGRIRDRQLQALRSVNRELVGLYWDIGELIHSKQEALGWGKSVVETLARDLQAEFPGRNGFSANNLWLMRQFYCEYVDKPNLQSMIGEISWTKSLVIFGRCKDDLEREFYLRATARFGWTTAVLKNQVDNKSYEKYLLNQTNFDATVSEEIKAQAMLAVKDRYTFDFLALADEDSERELEESLVKNVRSFLSEMGGAFAFIGNQYRLEVGGQEYFIDLLLFHRRLRCLVAIELKIGDFKPEHKGKMEFYLEALDCQERMEGENPPIGMIICRSKNKTVVEYALRTAVRPIGMATYTVVPQLPEAYREELLSPEEIAARLRLWEGIVDDE